MSDHEFNNYLTLLAGLLRLGDKQRRAIAEELRTHLEDRLEELLARGMSREDAIQRALAEFGDAAGLAAQFASISRGRRRRWLMRAMTFSVAVMILVAAGLSSFGPAEMPVLARPLPSLKLPPTVAQPSVEPTPHAEKPQLADVLNKTMDLTFDEMPLRNAVAMLSEKSGVTFYLSYKNLADAGFNIDSPVGGRFKNLKLRTILQLTLRDLDLTYVELEDAFLITTPDDAESRLVIRVYDCRDLLAMEAPPGADKFLPIAPVRAGGGFFAVQDEPPSKESVKPDPLQPVSPEASPALEASGDVPPRPITQHELRADRLVNLITTNVMPQTWSATGGPGSISEYNGLIVVTQTGDCHDLVERLLNMLRQAGGLDATKPKVVR